MQMISLHILQKTTFVKPSFLKLSNLHTEDQVDTVDNAQGRSATKRKPDTFRLANVYGCMNITVYSSYFFIKCKSYHFLSFKRQLFKGKLCTIFKFTTQRGPRGHCGQTMQGADLQPSARRSVWRILFALRM